jgi:hypothetical protein
MLIRDNADSENRRKLADIKQPARKNSPGQTFETAEGTGKQVKTSMREATLLSLRIR